MYQHDFILLDRSGSMSGSRWTEALSSINAYVKKLAKENIDTGVTVAAFDTDHDGRLDFTILRDRITPKTFRRLSNEDVQPRGGTPLSDAVGKMVALAESATYDRVAIIVVTDGEENSSREYSVKQAKEALDRCRKREWVVTFLGADFKNDAQATSYGSIGGFAASAAGGNMSDAFETLGAKRGFYSSTGTASDMGYTATEKMKLSTKKTTADSTGDETV